MPLHNYSTLVRTIDKSTAPLAKYLQISRTPMNLSHMMNHSATDMLKSVEQLAVRTAWCYNSFSDPIIARKMQVANNTEQLKWVQTCALREFKYCVALQEVAKRYTENKGKFGFPATAACDLTYVRNTDDLSYVDDVLNNNNSSSSSKAGERRVKSREDAEHALAVGAAELIDLPFDLALEILRPEESVIDLLVNEASFRSDKLNGWFYQFCYSRVAWRVLHEHLMHVTQPSAHPQVVCDDTDVLGLLEHAGNVVVDIYTKLNVDEEELTIHVEEDPSLLTSSPSHDTRLTSSTSSSSGYTSALTTPPTSAAVYSVEAHLSYVFRELLKNACVATMRWASGDPVTVKYAMDDRWVVVDFIDKAGGVPAAHTQDIWRFGWTSSDHFESHLGGFGVGLPISKVYVDMWGGSIDVFSSEGKGTTVRVRFPKSPTEVIA